MSRSRLSSLPLDTLACLAVVVSNACLFHSGRVLQSGVEHRDLAVAVEGTRIAAVKDGRGGHGSYPVIIQADGSSMLRVNQDKVQNS